MVGNHVDEHGCRPSTGYTWCETTNSCERLCPMPMPSVDPMPKPAPVLIRPQPVEHHMVGNHGDEHGCRPSTGYTWCETTNSCERNCRRPMPMRSVDPVPKKVVFHRPKQAARMYRL